MSTPMTTGCPVWCDNGEHCGGQHSSVPNRYIAATGSNAEQHETGTGVVLPSLGFAPRWTESFGGGRQVVIHDPESDTEYVFELYEAFELLRSLLDTYITASAGVHHPGAGLGGAEAFFRSVETLRAGIYRKDTGA